MTELTNIFTNNNFTAQRFNALIQNRPLDDVIAELAQEIFISKTVKPDEAVDCLKSVPQFTSCKTSVKTVGTYYRRMNNGGIERVISLLCDIWVRKGYKVVLFTEEARQPDDYPVNGEVVRVTVPKLGEHPTKEAFAERLRVLKEQIEKYNIDVFVHHAWLDDYLIFDEIAVKSTGVPFIVYAHGTFSVGLTVAGSLTSYMTAAQEKSYSLCDTVIALSKVDAEWWNELGIPACFVPNPPTYPIESTEVSSLDSKTVLWIGRFAEQKQIFEALKAIKTAHETVGDLKFYIIGKGETEEETNAVRDYVEVNGMSGYVEFKGFHTDVTPFYREGALTVMTSVFEGFPMVALESAIFGIPLLLYELPSIEIVRTNSGVTVVPQGNSRALGEKIAGLLENDELRKQKGREIRKGIEEMYVGDLGDRWTEIFDFALRKKEPLPPKYKRGVFAAAQSDLLNHVKINFEKSLLRDEERKLWIAHLEKDVAELREGVEFLRRQAEAEKTRADQKERELIELKARIPGPFAFSRRIIKGLFNKIKK